MKQNISPATAAIIAVVVIAVIALVGYKFFIAGSGKGKSSQTDQATMQNAMKNYGGNMRENALKASQRGTGGQPGMPGGQPGMPGR